MKLAIFGYGGMAREIQQHIKEDVTFFVDDKYTNEKTKPISEFDPKIYKIIIGVSNCNDRKKIVQSLPVTTEYFSFIHPTAIIMDDNVKLGDGSFIGANSIITTNVKIGKHSILNRGCQIGHDTVIGDFLSMMPGSIISGNVKVGNCFYMGTNSSVREKVNICDNVTIGLNGGVVKNINEKGVYVGLPVKKIK